MQHAGQHKGTQNIGLYQYRQAQAQSLVSGILWTLPASDFDLPKNDVISQFCFPKKIFVLF